MARTYKRDRIGRFASTNGSSKSGSKPSLRSRLARAQRSRMTNRNHNDRLGLSGASPARQAKVKTRIAKRKAKIAKSRAKKR